GEGTRHRRSVDDDAESAEKFEPESARSWHGVQEYTLSSDSRVLFRETCGIEDGRARLHPLIGFELLLERPQAVLERRDVAERLEFLTVVRVPDGQHVLPGVVVEPRLELELLLRARPEPDHGEPFRIPMTHMPEGRIGERARL